MAYTNQRGQNQAGLQRGPYRIWNESSLAKARRERGWTQQQLADAALVSKRTVIRAERGEASIWAAAALLQVATSGRSTEK